MNRSFCVLLTATFATPLLAAPKLPPFPIADFAGRPFVTQKAPVLKFERRTSPRPFGIDYAFAPQTARGVALFSRFPEFSLRDRRIHISGPWYNDARANLHFSRGITSIEAMPNFRLPGADPSTDVRNLPNSRKWQLIGDNLMWDHAKALADELAAQNPNDERIAPLRTLANDHRFSAHEAAYIELGKHFWRIENAPTDAKREGVLYPCLDIEATGGWEFQRECFGWIYSGIRDAAKERGISIIPVGYGQWTFSVGAFYLSNRQNGTGDPEYLAPDKDSLAGNDPTIRVFNETGGALPMDGYLQAMWGDEPFFKRDAKDTLVLQDGKPIWSDISQTTLYGQSVRLEKGEAQHALEDLYRQATRMFVMHHDFAGAYPDTGSRRKDTLKNARIGAWTRISNEGLQGIEQNDRPLPPWEIELLTGLYLFTADDVVAWSSDTNVASPKPGADNSAAWKYNAHGVVEYLVKAAHRYSALDELHSGDFNWCWFNLPLVNKNQTDGDRFEQKPLAMGKIRTFEGHPWLELFAAFPALDGKGARMKVWVDQGGKRSKTYTIALKNGRSYFYDAWQLPADFKGLQGKDVYLRFSDELGTVRTWRGDYREKVADNIVAPPDFEAGR